MKTMLRSLSYLLLFAGALALLLAATPQEMPTAGKFLVLRNGRTLEGDIQEVGDQFRVRRNGGETTIPGNLVLRLFLDTEDAYRFLRSRANLNDPDERLRLANWCLEYNLRAQAEEEASVALVLRPNDAEAKRLLAHIRETPPPVAPQPAQTPTPPPEPQLPASVVDLTPEAIGQFTYKVQPILTNACASCHAHERGGSFKLVRVPAAATLKRRATQANLAAVLAQINFVQPQASPLLTKAVSIHGGCDRAPFSSRQVVPYETLEDWLRTTLATNPQLLEHAGVAVVPPPPPIQETKSAFAENKTDPPHAGAPTVTETATIPPAVPPTVKPPDGGDDAFDPADFNRRAFPQRDSSPKP
jgi:hypothetical protein